MLPRVFIICSEQARHDASTFRDCLACEEPNTPPARCEVELWLDDPTAELGSAIMDRVEKGIRSADFTVCMLTPDDVLVDAASVPCAEQDKNLSSEKELRAQPRGNVLLEMGISLGALGRERTIILCDRAVKTILPSDLQSVLHVEYQSGTLFREKKVGRKIRYQEYAADIYQYIYDRFHGFEWRRQFLGIEEPSRVRIISHCSDVDKYLREKVFPPGTEMRQQFSDLTKEEPFEIQAASDTTWEAVWSADRHGVSGSDVLFVVDSPRENGIAKTVMRESDRILVGRQIRHLEDCKEKNVVIETLEARGEHYRTNKYSVNRQDDGKGEHLPAGTRVDAFGDFKDYLVLMKLPGNVISGVEHNVKTVWLLYGLTLKGTYAGACMFSASNLRSLEQRVIEECAGRQHAPDYFEALFEVSAAGATAVAQFENHRLLHFSTLSMKSAQFIGDPVPDEILMLDHYDKEALARVPLTSVHFDLVADCNFACPHCIEDHVCAKGLMLSTSTALRILLDLRRLGCEDLRFYGGEPTCHPEFSLILEVASSLGFNMLLVTNGSGLGIGEDGKPENPRLYNAVVNARNLHIRVSLDAHTPEAHARSHGIDLPCLPGIQAGLARLIEDKATVSISYLLTEDSEDDLEEACRFWHEKGAHSFHPRLPMHRHGRGYMDAFHQREWLEQLGSQYGDWFVVPKWLPDDGMAGPADGAPHCYAGYYRFAISPGTIDEKGDGLTATDKAWISLCTYYRYEEEFGCPYPDDLARWYSEERPALLERIRSRRACASTICSREETNRAIEERVKAGAAT